MDSVATDGTFAAKSPLVFGAFQKFVVRQAEMGRVYLPLLRSSQGWLCGHSLPAQRLRVACANRDLQVDRVTKLPRLLPNVGPGFKFSSAQDSEERRRLQQHAQCKGHSTPIWPVLANP